MPIPVSHTLAALILAMTCSIAQAQANTEATSPLTGITLSKYSWSTNQDNAEFFMFPISAKADLPLCTFSNPKVLSYSTQAPPTTEAAYVLINVSEATKLPQGKNFISIKCGDKSTNFVVDNLYTDISQPVVNFTRPATDKLKISVVRPASQVITTPPTRVLYWLTAYMPESTTRLSKMLQFLVPNGEGGYEWRRMKKTEKLENVALATQPASESAYDFLADIPAYFLQANAKIELAYKIGHDDPEIFDADDINGIASSTSQGKSAATVPPLGNYSDPMKLYVFKTVNQVRALAGAGYASQHEALDKAAQAHSDYFVERLKEYKETGVTFEMNHWETPGKSGFTGEGPSDRAAHFGYPKPTGEVLSGSASNMMNVWKLLGVPYHAWIIFGNYDVFGIGTIFKGALIMNQVSNIRNPINTSDGTGIAVFPCNNIQVNVQGQGYETPTPVVLNGKEDFGYSSIAVTANKMNVTSWVLVNAKGETVPTVIMGGSGQYTGAAALIPWDALPRIETSYTSTMTGTVNGTPFTKKCTFRTVAGYNVPQN